MKLDFDWPSGFWGEDTDGQTDDGGLPISLVSLRLSKPRQIVIRNNFHKYKVCKSMNCHALRIQAEPNGKC